MTDVRQADRSMFEPLEQRCLLSAGSVGAALHAPVAEPLTAVHARKAAAPTPKLTGAYVGKLWVGRRVIMTKMIITDQTFEPMRTAKGKFSAGKLASGESFGGFVSTDGTFAARMGLSRLYVNKIKGEKLQGSVRLWAGTKLVSGTFSVIRQVK
jgi:hypothetical protein